MPVSLSCVMLEAVTLKGGSSQESPLERSRSKIGAPRSPFGVWQFWQVMIVVTRYLPRSTGACALQPLLIADASSDGRETVHVPSLYFPCPKIGIPECHSFQPAAEPAPL